MADEKKIGKEKPNKKSQELLRALPKVDEALGWLTDLTDAPAALQKSAVREVVAEHRAAILAGGLTKKSLLARQAMTACIRERLARKQEPNLKTLINATGVVIHTNLGRSILPEAALEILGRAGTRYTNLEFDLATGKRGSRYSLVEGLLCELTGAEGALVVNNNAAAVLLVLDTLAKGREAVVSRGQLVEIGGSFRIPDVMVKSGVRLVEVGATNRTHLQDYENAINEQTGLLLKVHASNFRIIGFTSEVPVEDLVALGSKHGLPVMEDLGSGSLVDLSRFGLNKEPTVGEVIKAGVDVVTFSGDKLLGGPQAGLILGRKEIIDRVKKNALNRALRVDKFTLASLETVLRLYFDEAAAFKSIPTLAMLTMPLAVIDRRAKRLAGRIKKKLARQCAVRVVDTGSRVGGGALPEQNLPSRAVALVPGQISLNELEQALRVASPPIIGRIEDDCFLLDMRTVADDELGPLAACLAKVFGVSGK